MGLSPKENMCKQLCLALVTWYSSICFTRGFPEDVYKKEYRWIEEGDINIGVILSIHSSNSLFNCTNDIQDVRNVQNVEAMNFAISEINRDNTILPNLTLGFVVLDDCQSPSMALARAIQFMPKDLRTAGKYNTTISESDKHKKTERTFYDVTGIIGTYTSKLSIVVANVLNLFQLPQISHTATSNVLSDKSRFPYFFRMIPPDRYQVKAIASVLGHFRWSHMSIVFSEGSYGRDGVKELKNALQRSNSGVCIEEAIEIADGATEQDFINVLKTLNSQANTKVVVAFVEIEHAVLVINAVDKTQLQDRFIWIGSDSLSLLLEENQDLCGILPGSISLHPHALNISSERFSEHLKQLVYNGNQSSRNPWLQELQKFYRKSRNISSNSSMNLPKQTCIFDPHNHKVRSTFVDSFLIDSVYALAHALNIVVNEYCEPGKVGYKHVAECVSRIGIFNELKSIRFNGLHGELKFNEEGDIMTRYEVHQCFKGSITHRAEIKSVGSWDMNGETLQIVSEKILWTPDTIPSSACPKPCTETTGTIYYFRKQKCCHVCVTCKVNEIVVANATRCEPCAELFWPEEKTRTKCLPITPYYFGLRNPVSISLCTVAIVGALFCFAIIVILVKYRDEHVVKCFSVELSGIILLGTLLTYGLSTSFLSHPNSYKCYVNHVGFSVTFTMIYAPLLVKTNRIYRIFNAGRRTTRKPCFISTTSQVFFSIALIFCQVAIVIISTSLEPPEILLQMPQRTEKFVELFCNIPQAGLLASLSYNLILVVICTFYAFKTRKLPDNYKESRYIAFCVDTTLLIWITFVPTYFTTTRAAAKTTILAISLLLNASVTVTCLFIPRIYSLYKSLRNNSSTTHNYKDFRIVKHVVKRKHSTVVEITREESGMVRRFSSVLTSNSDFLSRDPSELVVSTSQGSQTCVEMTRVGSQTCVELTRVGLNDPEYICQDVTEWIALQPESDDKRASFTLAEDDED